MLIKNTDQKNFFMKYDQTFIFTATVMELNPFNSVDNIFVNCASKQQVL